MKTEEVFKTIKQRIGMYFSQLNGIRMLRGKKDDKEHKKNARHYATFHSDRQMITYASAMDDLPDTQKAGIILHEFGHALDDLFGEDFRPKILVKPYEEELKNIPHEDKYDEAIANFLIDRFFDTHIYYDPITTVQYIEEESWQHWLS